MKAALTLITSYFGGYLTPIIPPETLLELSPEAMTRELSSSDYSVSLSLKTFGVILLFTFIRSIPPF
jgi:hypothetical protein